MGEEEEEGTNDDVDAEVDTDTDANADADVDAAAEEAAETGAIEIKPAKRKTKKKSKADMMDWRISYHVGFLCQKIGSPQWKRTRRSLIFCAFGEIQRQKFSPQSSRINSIAQSKCAQHKGLHQPKLTY